MAIAALEQVTPVPSKLKAPCTWGDLQALNSIVPGTFYKERGDLLADPERSSTFATLNSVVTQATWSRQETDNPQEALPKHLRKAATDMLDLLGVLESEDATQPEHGIGAQISAGVSSLITAVRGRLT